MSLQRVYRANLVHCLSLSPDDFQIFSDALIGINSSGFISFVGRGDSIKELSQQFQFDESKVEILGQNKFLVPGLIDTHLHAPQYAMAGTGTDLPLLDWLNKYTFPTESKFSDENIARKVFSNVIKRTLSYGTTTGCYFTTIHLESTKLFADLVTKIGQRAYVGKVCMDRNSPDFYVENSAQESLDSTEEFIKYVQNDENRSKLVTPVITPRFVPTCSETLLKGLGELATRYNVPIQSHIAENCSEVGWVKELHPEQSSYTDVYKHFGLMNDKTIMAHGIYLSDDELKTFSECGSGISHCPVSNFTLSSGVLDVRRALDAGVKVGLGTDVSGGYSSSLWETIRQSVLASNTFKFGGKSYKEVNFKEAFALATLGGAQVLGLEDKVGNFIPGKAFDAQIIDLEAKGSNIDLVEWDSIEDKFQKFLFLGDNRNVESVFVNGRLVAGTSHKE